MLRSSLRQNFSWSLNLYPMYLISSVVSAQKHWHPSHYPLNMLHSDDVLWWSLSVCFFLPLLPASISLLFISSVNLRDTKEKVTHYFTHHFFPQVCLSWKETGTHSVKQLCLSRLSTNMWAIYGMGNFHGNWWEAYRLWVVNGKAFDFLLTVEVWSCSSFLLSQW